MNRTAPVLTTEKAQYCQRKCLESLLGGHEWQQPTKNIVLQIVLTIVTSIQTYLIAYFVELYVIVLVVPALINAFLMMAFIAITTDHSKQTKELLITIMIVAGQTVLTASSMYHNQSIIEIFVFILLFPRDQQIELGYTTSEQYSRSLHGCLYLIIIIILDNIGINAIVIRIIYYLTPLMFFIGLYGQFSQSLEYFIEQANFLMGSTPCYNWQRSVSYLLVNCINIGIVIAVSYADEHAAPFIVCGILSLSKQIRITTPKQQDKQLYKSCYCNRRQLQVDIIVGILTIGVIILGSLVGEFYQQVFYALIALYIILSITHVFNKHQKYLLILISIVQNLMISMLPYQFNGIFEDRLFIAFYLYRLYNLSHYNVFDLFVEQIVAISLNTEYTMAYNLGYYGVLVSIAFRCLIRMIPRIKIFAISNYQMLVVKKQRVSNAICILGGQLLLLPLTVGILIASSLLDVPYMPMLGLPMFTVASLRPLRNSPNISKYIEGSSEASIYNSFLNQAIEQLLTGIFDSNHYLIRIGKYLGIVHLLEQTDSYVIIQFKGLESQETTSCHGVEAREVDRLVLERDWMSAITMQRTVNVSSYEENQIILTGIIEAQEFVQGFKQIFMKMLCYYSDMITEQHNQDIIKMSKQFDGSGSHYPEQFSNILKLHLKFEGSDTDDQRSHKSPTAIVIKSKHNDDDLMAMLDELDHQPKVYTKQHKQSLYDQYKRAILLIYQVSLQDLEFNISRINQKLLFELFSDKKCLMGRRQFFSIDPIFGELATKAVRTALKISLDVYSIEGHLQLSDASLLEEIEALNDTYVGMGNEVGWQGAMQSKLLLWSLGYEQGRNQLVVYRSTFKEVESQIFRFNTETVRGIEANLQMELLFVSNDDEERYSIQTHEKFLRNMIIESSELPLGYAPFYSGPIQLSIR